MNFEVSMNILLEILVKKSWYNSKSSSSRTKKTLLEFAEQS